MNYPKLEWFLAVVEAGGISKAAETLYVSQQSVSAYIKRLETFYGIRLFDRSSGFSLTAQGMILYQYATQIIQRERKLLNTYADILANRTGRIRFGLSVARSQLFLPKIIPVYRERYPNVKVLLYEESTAALAKHLCERSIDLYLGKDLDVPFVRREVLSHERLFVIVTKPLLDQYFNESVDAGITRFREGVFLKELEPLPFITIDPSGKLFRSVDTYCLEHEIHLNSVSQVANTPLLIESCRKGLGAGLCLETFLTQVLLYSSGSSNNAISIFPIRDQISDWKIVMADYEKPREPQYFSDFKVLVRNAVAPINPNR